MKDILNPCGPDRTQVCAQGWIPDKSDLNKSRYLWLPVDFDPQTGYARTKYYEKWNPLQPEE